MANQIKLNELLKKVRLRHGYNQKNMADLIGGSQSKYSKIERGQQRPTYKMMIELRKKFKLNWNKILENEE